MKMTEANKTIDLPESIYSRLVRAASGSGTTPALAARGK
jgi:hypothetical protein